MKVKVGLLNKKINQIKIFIASIISITLTVIICLSIAMLNQEKEKENYKLLNIYSIYSINKGYNYSSTFSNVKILNVANEYTTSNSSTHKYLEVQCEIIEDFYNELDQNTVINVTFQFKNAEYSNISSDISQIVNWFYKLDSLCLYANFQFQSINNNDKEIIFNQNLRLSHENTIPIINNKVDLESVYEIYNDGGYNELYFTREDYTNYINQGMPAGTLFENLRKLYIEQLERY